jgi:hypothetical protein
LPVDHRSSRSLSEAFIDSVMSEACQPLYIGCFALLVRRIDGVSVRFGLQNLYGFMPFFAFAAEISFCQAWVCRKMQIALFIVDRLFLKLSVVNKMLEERKDV